jgi:hypothetical protein
MFFFRNILTVLLLFYYCKSFSQPGTNYYNYANNRVLQIYNVWDDPNPDTASAEGVLDIPYPDSARRNNIEGTVYVSFVIDKDGRYMDWTLQKDFGYGSGTIVLNSLKKMRKWEPVKISGQNISTVVQLEIQFRIKRPKPDNNTIEEIYETINEYPEPITGYPDFIKNLMDNFKCNGLFNRLSKNYEVELLVGAKGEVIDAKIIDGKLNSCSDKLLEMISQSRWRPGRCNSIPLPSIVIIDFQPQKK